MHVRAYACMLARSRVRACTHTHTHTQTNKQTNKQTHTHTHTHIRARACAKVVPCRGFPSTVPASRGANYICIPPLYRVAKRSLGKVDFMIRESSAEISNLPNLACIWETRQDVQHLGLAVRVKHFTTMTGTFSNLKLHSCLQHTTLHSPWLITRKTRSSPHHCLLFSHLHFWCS